MASAPDSARGSKPSRDVHTVHELTGSNIITLELIDYPAANELTINNVTFLNVDEDSLSHELKQFLQQTHDHILNLNGETVSRRLNYVLLSMLEREIPQPYRRGIQQLISINSGMPRDQSVVSSKETRVMDSSSSRTAST